MICLCILQMRCSVQGTVACDCDLPASGSLCNAAAIGRCCVAAGRVPGCYCTFRGRARHVRQACAARAWYLCPVPPQMPSCQLLLSACKLS
jgi:hypothetical protein